MVSLIMVRLVELVNETISHRKWNWINHTLRKISIVLVGFKWLPKVENKTWLNVNY